MSMREDVHAGLDERTLSTALGLTGALLFSFLVGLGASIAIPLPPDGVPMTLQTLFVVLAALGLGARWGTLSMMIYIVAGMIGVPMFAGGEKVGLAVILGQTGGYLVGFVACQPVVRWIVRRKDGSVRAWWWVLLAALAGHLVVFVFGVPWLWFVRHGDDPSYGMLDALRGGFVPFIPGMVIKCLIAAIAGYWAAPFASRRGW